MHIVVHIFLYLFHITANLKVFNIPDFGLIYGLVLDYQAKYAESQNKVLRC